MKKKAIFISLIVLAISVFAYFANATTHEAPVGTTWSVNGVPVILPVIQQGTYQYDIPLPNGYIISCLASQDFCWACTSSILVIYDGLDNSPKKIPEGNVTTYTIIYEKH